MIAVAPLAELIRRGLAAGHETILIAGDGEPVSRARFRALVAAARRELARHGEPRGRRIALHGSVTPGLLACLVAALLDGAVIVPLDAELPALRKATMLGLAAEPERAGGSRGERGVLVVDFEGGAASFAERAAIVDAAAWTAVPVGADAELAQAMPLDDDAACYVFFTSGTTGAPKGVLGRRRGLAHFLTWEVGMLELAPGDRVSLLTRLSFDVVLRDILAPIVGGATGCIAPRGRAAAAMLAWLDDRAITVTHVVPSLSRGLLAAVPAGFAGRALRHTLFAGEPLSGSLVRRWRDAFPHTAVYNLYGPTETTLAKFCARIPATPGDGVLPCGHPLPDTEAVILDADRAVVAPGETGEVAIATPHRSLGYLDAAQTRDRFVRAAGREVYLTGDLGFVAPDGQLHLRGRKDDQVKILGVRIELAGVASVIQSMPGVADAAVICIDDDADKRLIGYFVAAGDGAAIAPALRPYLAERLPPAAIPSRFIELAAMPLTPNGKLDRSRLPRPAVDPAPGAAPEPAADPIERAVAEAFAAALGRPVVGALDDFFALGGDSLAAAGVCAAIADRLDAYLAPVELLTAATPRALAERVRAASPPAAIPRAKVQRYFALTPQQRRYVRTFCAGGNRSWCNMVAVFALPAATSRAAVEEALAEIAARHDSLRLAFSFDDAGELRQSIDFRWDPRVTERDLSALSPAAARAALDRLRTEAGEQPISPIWPIWPIGPIGPIGPASRPPAPLFRAELVVLPGDDRRLLWTVHHLVSDGTSQGILGRELAAALAGQRPSEAARFAQRSFVDVAAWATERPGLAAARTHFRAVFATPYRHPYLPVRIACDDPQRCLSLELAMPAAARDAARSLARGHRTTPYVVLLAALFRMWARRTGASDVAIVTPLAGRDHPQIAPLIGDFINLVALRIPDVLALPAPRLIEAVVDQVGGASRHQALQFDELLDELGVAFDPDRNPLTGVSLNFMAQPGRMPAITGAVTDKGYKLKYDLLLVIRDHDDATCVELQFRAGLLDATAATQLLEQLFTVTEDLGHD